MLSKVSGRLFGPMRIFSGNIQPFEIGANTICKITKLPDKKEEENNF